MLRRACLVLFSAVGSVAALAAQQPPGQGGFVPIEQLPPSEQLPSAPLLVAAYAFVWVALMVYVWSVWRRLGKVEAELRALEQKTRK